MYQLYLIRRGTIIASALYRVNKPLIILGITSSLNLRLEPYLYNLNCIYQKFWTSESVRFKKTKKLKAKTSTFASRDVKSTLCSWLVFFIVSCLIFDLLHVDVAW